MLDENPEELISLTLGNKLYEMSNHLGNVLTVINDIKVPQATNSVDVDGYLATIVSTADYSPFGVQLDERTVSAESYRYGFQGQEKDDEIKGAGNSVNYTYRMHDPRLGRFFAVDPLASKYPYNSPYAFSENVVISHVELEGREKKEPKYKQTRSIFGVSINQRIRTREIDGRFKFHWNKTKLDPVPQKKPPCFEDRPVEVTTVTTVSCSTQKIETGMRDEIGTSTLGGIVTKVYNSGAGDYVYWDTHGDPDKIIIRNVDSGAIIYENENLASERIEIPCDVNYSVEIIARGSNTCRVYGYENQEIETTKTEVYRDGVLHSSPPPVEREMNENKNDCPSECPRIEISKEQSTKTVRKKCKDS